MTHAQTTGIERVPYGLGKAIEAVKEAVPVEDYAGTLTDLRKAGNSLRGPCPVHGGDNPQSFAVFPEGQRWRCFRCSEGGDLLDLYQAVEGGEVQWAVQDLAQRFGVALPNTRTDTWHAWQGEKIAIEELAEHVRFQVRCRRVFKLLVLSAPEIQDLEDPDERRDEIAACWKAFTEGMVEIDREKKRKRLRRISA